MKVAVFFGIFLVIIIESQSRSIYEQSQTEEAQEYFSIMARTGKECGKELDPEKVKDVPDIHGMLQIPEDNESLNAVLGCVFKKRGIIDGESRIDITVLKAYAWEIFTAAGNTTPFYLKAAGDLAKFCYSVKGKDYGQTAVILQNCIMQYMFERHLRK